MGCSVDVSIELLPPESPLISYQEFKESPFLQVDWNDSSTLITGSLKNEDYRKLEQFYQELASNHQAGVYASAGDVLARVLHRLYPLSGNLADTLIWLLEKGPCGQLPIQKSSSNTNHSRFLICIHWRSIPGCSKDITPCNQEFASFSTINHRPYLSCSLNLNPNNLSKLGLEPKFSRISSFTPSIQLRRFGCRKTMSPENDSFTKDSKGSMFRYVKNVFTKKHFRKKKNERDELTQDINPVYILKLSESEDEEKEKTYSSESEESLPCEENSFSHSKSIIYHSKLDTPNIDFSSKVKILKKEESESSMNEKSKYEEETAMNDLKYSENNLLEKETLLINRSFDESHKHFFDNILHSINIPNHSENSSKEEENILCDDIFESQPANYSQNIGYFMNSVDELNSNFMSENREIINTNPDTRSFPENGNFVVKSAFIEDILSSNPLLRKKPYYLPHSKLKNEEKKVIIKEQPKIEKSNTKLVEKELPTMADFNSLVSPLLLFKSPLNLEEVSVKNRSMNKCRKENVYTINVSPKNKKHKPKTPNEPKLDACNSSLISPLTMFNSPLSFDKSEIEAANAQDVPKRISETSESDQRIDSSSISPDKNINKSSSYPIGDIGKEQIGANCLIEMVHRAAEMNLLDKRTAFDLAVDAMSGSTSIGLNEKITPKPKLSPERFHPPPPKFPAPSCLPINTPLAQLPTNNNSTNEEDDLINVFQQLAILNHKCKSLLNDFDDIKVENTPTTISSEEMIRIVTHLSPQNCFDDSSNATMHTEEVTKNESDMDTNKELWTRYLNENIFAEETIHQDRINPFKKINPAETTTNPVKLNHITHYRRKFYSLNNEPNWMHHLGSSRSAFQFSTIGADPTDLLSCTPLSETRINCNIELKLFRKRMNHLLCPPPTLADSPLIVPHDIIPLEAKPCQFSMNVLSLDGGQLLNELIDKENAFLDINQPLRKTGGIYFYNLIDDERFCFLESKFESDAEYRMCINIERSQRIQKESKLHNTLLKQSNYNTTCSLLLAKFIDMNAKSKFIKYKNNRLFLKKPKANLINIFQRRIRSGLSSSINSDPSHETIIQVNEKIIIEKNKEEKVELFKIEEDKPKITFDVKTELQQFVMEFGNFISRKSNNSSISVKEKPNSTLSDSSSFDSNFLIKENFLEPVLGPIQFILDHKDDIPQIDSQEDSKEIEIQMQDKAVETFQEMNTNITTMAVQCRMTENITDSGQTTGSSLTNNSLGPVISQEICLKEFYNNVLASLEKMEHSINQVFCFEKLCTIISPKHQLPLLRDQPTSPIRLGSNEIISTSEHRERKSFKNIFLGEKSIQKLEQNFSSSLKTNQEKKKKKKKKEPKAKESLKYSKDVRTSFLNNRVTSPCININQEDSFIKEEKNILLANTKLQADDNSSNSKYNFRTAYIQKEKIQDDFSPSVNVVFTNTEGELKSSSSSSACRFMQISEAQEIQTPSKRDIGTIRTKINLTATTLPNLSLSDRIYHENSSKLRQINNIPSFLQSKEIKVPNSKTLFSKKLNIYLDDYKNYYNRDKLNKEQIENKNVRKKVSKINKKLQISPVLTQQTIELPLSTNAIRTRTEVKRNFIYNWRPALYIPSTSRVEEDPIVIKIKKPSRNKDLEVLTFDKFLKSENKSLEFGNPNIQCKVINNKNSLEQTNRRPRTKPMGVHSLPLKNPNLLREIILGKCPGPSTGRDVHPLQGDPNITALDKIRFITAIQPSDNPHPSLLFTNDFCYLKPYLGFDNSSKNSTTSNIKPESVFGNLENSFPKTKQEMSEHLREIKEMHGEYKTRKRHNEETRKENISKRHHESKSPSRFQNGNTKPKLFEAKSHRKNSTNKDYVTTCTAMGAGQWNREYPSKKSFSLPSTEKTGSHLFGPFLLLNKLSEGIDHVVQKTISYLHRADSKSRRK